MRQKFEDNYASYYVNTEVWSSDRLKKGRNIYANRYNDTSKRFCGFWHLMRSWKGSVIKLIYHDFLLYITIFMAINLVYRYVLYKYSNFCDNNVDPDQSNLGIALHFMFQLLFFSRKSEMVVHYG